MAACTRTCVAAFGTARRCGPSPSSPRSPEILCTDSHGRRIGSAHMHDQLQTLGGCGGGGFACARRGWRHVGLWVWTWDMAPPCVAPRRFGRCGSRNRPSPRATPARRPRRRRRKSSLRHCRPSPSSTPPRHSHRSLGWSNSRPPAPSGWCPCLGHQTCPPQSCSLRVSPPTESAKRRDARQRHGFAQEQRDGSAVQAG